MQNVQHNSGYIIQICMEGIYIAKVVDRTQTVRPDEAIAFLKTGSIERFKKIVVDAGYASKMKYQNLQKNKYKI